MSERTTVTIAKETLQHLNYLSGVLNCPKSEIVKASALLVRTAVEYVKQGKDLNNVSASALFTRRPETVKLLLAILKTASGRRR